MALIRPGGGVAQASGALGGLVFSHNRSGQYVRARSSPVQPDTYWQSKMKGALSGASAEWAGLTAGRRLAWNAWAQNNPVPNRLGDMIRLQGNAAFCQINARQLFNTSPLILDPPTGAAPGALIYAVSTFDIGAGGCELTYTATPLQASEYLYVRGAVLLSVGQNFVTNKIRWCGLSGAAQASPFDWQSIVEGRLGTLVVGMKVVLMVQVWDQSTGLVSVPRRVEGTVVTT